MARLTEILKQEYQSKGVFSGAASAVGKSLREKTDLRNILFGGSGLGSIIGQKIFGKGYRAIDKKVTSPTSDGASSAISSLDSKMNEIADNTSYMRGMARDVYLMKQNIAKMVRLSGGTPQTKSGDWVSRQDARRAGKMKTSPVKVDKPVAIGATGSLGSMGSFFSGLIGTLTSSFLPIIAVSAVLYVALDGLANMIKSFVNWIADTSVGKLMGIKKIEGIGPFGRDYGNQQSSSGTPGEMASQGSPVVDAIAGTGMIASGIYATKGAAKLYGAAKATKSAIGAASVASNPYVQMSGANYVGKGKWPRFLAWLAKKSPSLMAKFGARLAAAGALATIPFVGWIAAAVQLGFSLWTAYEIYQWWREFNNSSDETATTSPTQLSEGMIDSDYKGMIGAREGGAAGYNAIYGYGKEGGDQSIVKKYGKNLSELTIGQALAIGDSRMKDNAGALGKYQFMPNTLRGLLKPAGLSEKDMFSPENQDKLMDVFTKQNAAALEKSGVSPTVENLSLAHAVGASGAQKLLKADPNANAAEVLGLTGKAKSTNPQLDTSVRSYLAGRRIEADSIAARQGERPIVIATTNNIQNGNRDSNSGNQTDNLNNASVTDADMFRFLTSRMS